MDPKIQDADESALEVLLTTLPPGAKVDVNFTPDGAIYYIHPVATIYYQAKNS